MDNRQPISELASHEELLAALRALFEQTAAPILVMDAEGRFITANAAALCFLETDLAELCQKGVWDYLPPGHCEGQRREQHFCGRRTAESEFLVNGKIKTLLLDLLPTSLGGQTLLVAIGHDITERKRAAKELAWEAGVNAAMAELARALISATDDDVAWLVLEHAKRLTGSRFGFVGYVDPQTGWFVNATLTRDIWDLCQVEDKEVIFRRFGGLWGWVLKHRQPILANDPASDPRSTGTPAGHVPIQRFLAAPAMMGDTLVGQVALANAERNYDERDLELVQRLAAIYAVAVHQRRMARLRDAFLTLAAHELRTPLSVLKGYAELLTKRGGHDPAEGQAFKALKAHGDRVARLVQAMLDVVHIQGGSLSLARERVDLSALARQVAATVQTAAPEHRLWVTGEERLPVVGDRLRLGTVLWHLLENAVRFSPEGGPVEVAVVRRENEAIVSVRDFGIGIPPERQAEVFEAFFQVAPMESPTTGMGLGLYVCREIISRHGGRLWVESELGKGSVFFFTLPLPRPSD